MSAYSEVGIKVILRVMAILGNDCAGMLKACSVWHLFLHPWGEGWWTGQAGPRDLFACRAEAKRMGSMRARDMQGSLPNETLPRHTFILNPLGYSGSNSPE